MISERYSTLAKVAIVPVDPTSTMDYNGREVFSTESNQQFIFLTTSGLDYGDGSWVMLAAGGNTPGGTTGQVQFNNNGVLDGIPESLYTPGSGPDSANLKLPSLAIADPNVPGNSVLVNANDSGVPDIEFTSPTGGVTIGINPGMAVSYILTLPSTLPSNSLQELLVATDGTIHYSLSGVTPAIGGSALTLGQQATDTVTLVGASGAIAAGAIISVTPATEGAPGDGFVWTANLTGTDIITVKVICLVAGTPTSSVYNVKVL